MAMSERRTILRAAGIVGLFTLLSRLTGLIRDALLAAKLGDTRLSDIFYTAFMLPNLVRRVLGEGALSSFIVPLFEERRRQSGDAGGWRFINITSNFLMVVALLITLGGGYFAREIFIAFGGSGLIDEAARVERQFAYPLVDLADLDEPVAIARRLQAGDPFAARLAAHAPAEFARLLGAGDGIDSPTLALRAGVVATLNAALDDPGRERAAREAGIEPGAMAPALDGGANAAGALRARNRHLVSQGFPDAIGWSAEQYLAIGERMTRIMFPFVIGLTLASIMMGACHALRSFTTPSLGSVMLNLTMIAAAGSALALGTSVSRAAIWLSWSVLAGALLRIAIMVPTLRRFGWRWQPVMNFSDPQLRKLLRMMGVGLSSLAIVQVNIAVVGYFAIALGAGVRTYLSYADRLIQFPMGLTAVAVATAMLPQLTQYMIEGRHHELADMMAFTKRLEIIVMLPAILGLMFFGLPIVELVLEHGIFSPAASWKTYTVIFVYAPALLPMSWSQIVMRLFYARQDVVNPLKASAAAMLTNIFGCWFFTSVFPLNQVGLALAFTISSFVYYFVLAWYLKRTAGLESAPVHPRIGETMWKAGAAALVACGLGFAGYAALRLQFGKPEGIVLQSLTLLPSIGAVTVLYFFLIHWLRVPDSEQAAGMILRKLRRKRG